MAQPSLIAHSHSNAGHDSEQSPRKPSDRRIGQIHDQMQGAGVLNKAISDNVTDSLQSGIVESQRFLFNSQPIVWGKVIEAIPYVNWYKVSLDGGLSTLGCCLATGTTMLPIGVRQSSIISPGNFVIVARRPGADTGVILGAVPERLYEGKFQRAEWVQQGAQSGFKREAAHYENLKIFEHEGNVQDFSNGRPLDSENGGEFTHMSEMGGCFHADSFQSFMRISEICGLWLNYYDNYAKLFGWNLDIETASGNIVSRLDEGEAQYVQQSTPFYWEALGAYGPGTEFTEENDDKAVQYDEPVGKIDQIGAKEKLDLAPIWRVRNYGGYLGQGGYQHVMIPRQIGSGLEKFDSDSPKEQCAFSEAIALDGQMITRSAKSILIEKRLPGPVPKMVKYPEDQVEGEKDSIEDANYKFAGSFGGGEDHTPKDVLVEGELTSLRRAAGALDMAAYAFNFKTLHPFHYHYKDYKLDEESALEQLKEVTDKLDFATLKSKMYMKEPEPVTRQIDHRYGEVNYYKRNSYLSLTEDGGMLNGCGFGCEVRMVSGTTFITAPGDLMLQAGRSVRLWAGDDIDVRANSSIDIVATEKDVRIKAEKNMELLSANGGEGGCIIENRATSFTHKYEQNEPGEFVEGSGILLRTPMSQTFVYANEIYLRTGGGEGSSDGEGAIKPGPIVLDASRGDREVIIRGSHVDLFAESAVNHIFGDAANPTSANCFTETIAEINTPMELKGLLCVVDAGITCDQNITIVNAHISSIQGDHVSKLVGKPLSDARASLEKCRSNLAECVTRAKTEHYEPELKTPFYDADKIGNNDKQTKIMVSLRDDPSQTQYNSSDFKLVESRWQQMSRLALGDTVDTWTEKAVKFQGTELFPYPGKKKWTEETTFQQLEELTMFDVGQRHSKDRNAVDATAPEYAFPILADWKPVIPNGTYQIIKP